MRPPRAQGGRAAGTGAGRSSLSTLVAQSAARKVAFIYCAEAESCSNQHKRVQEYAPVLGAKLVYDAQVSIAAPDYTAQVLAARNAGADAVVMVLDYASI